MKKTGKCLSLKGMSDIILNYLTAHWKPQIIKLLNSIGELKDTIDVSFVPDAVLGGEKVVVESASIMVMGAFLEVLENVQRVAQDNYDTAKERVQEIKPTIQGPKLNDPCSDPCYSTSNDLLEETEIDL